MPSEVIAEEAVVAPEAVEEAMTPIADAVTAKTTNAAVEVAHELLPTRTRTVLSRKLAESLAETAEVAIVETGKAVAAEEEAKAEVATVVVKAVRVAMRQTKTRRNLTRRPRPKDNEVEAGFWFVLAATVSVARVIRPN